MSVAIVCARTLRDVLSKHPDLDALPRRYYAVAKRFAWQQWDTPAQLDLRWNGTDGAPPWHRKLSTPIALVCGYGVV